MKSQSPMAILVIGIVAVLFLGYMSSFLLEGNPTVQKLLDVHRTIQKKYGLPHLTVSFYLADRRQGTLLTYRPSPQLKVLPLEGRMVQLARDVFSYQRKMGRGRARQVWRMPRTFVLVQELEAQSEKVAHSKKITPLDVAHFIQGLAFQKDWNLFAKTTFASEFHSQFTFTFRGWKGRVKIELVAGKPKDTAKKCIQWVKNYKKARKKFLLEFTVEVILKGHSDSKYTSSYRPGLVVLPPSSGGSSQ